MGDAMTTDRASALKWLRRGLATFVGLLGLAVTCALIWGLLASMGDHAGAKAFRWITLGVAITDGVCGMGLFIGAVCSLMQLWDTNLPSQNL